MNNVTKIKISKPAQAVFEAFVDPQQIGKFWFSSSSARWEAGKTITLRYDEYGAEGDIRIISIEENRQIVFQWGADGQGNTVTITLHPSGDDSTIVEVNEEGFAADEEHLIHHLLDNKEGWVYMLTCLKGSLEFGIHQLRAGLVKG